MPKLALPVLQALGQRNTVFSSKEAASTDCSYCRAPCCQLLVELMDDEYKRFEWEWVQAGERKFRILKRRPEDGYCVYFVHGKGCSTYEDKPWVCDYYSCRNDDRMTKSLKYGKVKPIG